MIITNGTLYTMDSATTGAKPVKADLRVLDGKITEIAPQLATTAGEDTFDATGLAVIPGIVDASSKLGLRVSGMRWEGNDADESSENNISDLSTLDGFHPLDVTIDEALRGGITTAVLGSGETSVIGAKSAAIHVGHAAPDVLALDSFVALGVTFGNHVKRLTEKNGKGELPRSRMGIASILRRAVQEAELYGAKKAQEKIDEKTYDPKHETMLAVIEKKVPLRITAYLAEDILTAIRLCDEYGLRLVLNQAVEAHLVLDEIAKRGIPVILGQYLNPVDDQELLGRRMDLAAILQKAAVPIAFATHADTLTHAFLRINAALAVKNGLSEDAALAALTINPATIFGIQDRIGTLAPGKSADLAILDGPPLYSMSRVVKTMVAGVWAD